MRNLLTFVLAIAMSLAFGQDDVEPGQAKVKLGSGQSEEERMMRAFEIRFVNQADEWFDDGDYHLIAELLEVHVALHPDSYELVTNLGWMYGNMQEYAKELVTYIEYRKRFPENPEAWYPEGQFYFFKKNYKMVVETLGHTIDMKPRPHANTYRILARAYKSTGYLKEALAVYKELIKLDPDDMAAKKNASDIEKILAGG